MNKKNKEIKEEIKTPEQPVSNIRSYFTKEINDQISEMSLNEMESLMKEMITTRGWIALLKYTSMRTPILDATLRSADPIKEPSKISWAQGCMAGICDIESYVIDLNAPKKEQKPEENTNGNPEGIIG